MTFILVMAAVALADVFWTLYFIATEQRKAVAAAAWSASIVLLSAYTVTEYVHDRKLVIAAVLGAFIGTYATVRFKKKDAPAL